MEPPRSSPEVGEKSEKPASARKPYRPPMMIKLGTVKELTKSVSSSGKGDGGRGTFKRTGRGGHAAG